MYLTGGILPQPMVYRCSVDEEWRIQLPVEVRQALNVRPEHRVDLTVKGNKVEMAHAWPCCQLCGGRGEGCAASAGASSCASPCLKQLREQELDRLPPPAGGRGSVGGLRRLEKRSQKQVFFL